LVTISRRYITVPLEWKLFNAVSEASGKLRLPKSTFIRLLLIRELASTSYLTDGEKKAVKIIGRLHETPPSTDVSEFKGEI